MFKLIQGQDCWIKSVCVLTKQGTFRSMLIFHSCAEMLYKGKSEAEMRLQVCIKIFNLLKIYLLSISLQ